MGPQAIFGLLFTLILIGYAVLYVTGRHYLKDGFQSGSGEAAGAGSPMASQLYPTPPPTMPSGPGRVIMEYVTPDTVAKDTIQSVDDYEYNYVFQNENDRELSQALRNKLMSQRPMDWAGLPPSSAEFQAGVRESFENAKPTVPDSAQPFRDVNGENMVPPDIESVEMEERKILQTYQAPTAKDLESYSAEDAAAQDPHELIQKLYDQKGLVPTVAHKEGTNVYEIVGVRRKDEKVVYEDEEAPASVGPVPGAGEARIQVPATAYDVAAAKDPYYDATAPGAGTSSRMGKWDYQAWTPGLERMFAPSNDKQNWY
jgi:hypothetical protein